MCSGFPEVGLPLDPRIVCGGIMRIKFVTIAHRALSNTLVTTFFASKYSSAN
jgi:hypothetical protein